MRIFSFLFWLLLVSSAFGAPSMPNIVIILTDDMGYGDLSVQGNPLIQTPHIDQLAREGQRWTSFYASASVCGPSRMALMTGRMPIRIGGTGKNEWISLPDSEITLAELLKQNGYATAYIGKWGLANGDFDYAGGHPNDQGFDFFLGTVNGNYYPWRRGFELTYENIKRASIADFPIPLYRQRQVVEQPLYQPTTTKRFTEEGIRWMQAQGDKPFFLFLSHNMPHVPLFRSSAFEGHSKAGIYGDVIEEIDWSVGKIVEALHNMGVAENTLVIFTSDNGPWREVFDLGGSAGPLRGGKGSAWEGGFRLHE